MHFTPEASPEIGQTPGQSAAHRGICAVAAVVGEFLTHCHTSIGRLNDDGYMRTSLGAVP